MKNHSFLLILIVITGVSCQRSGNSAETENTTSPNYETTGTIEVISAELEQVLDPSTPIQILAEGFDWSEGPLWVETLHAVLFSDIPPNQIRLWQEGLADSLYLYPSGFTGEKIGSEEPGSNGLLLNPEGQLVLCQHGDRRIALMEAPLDQPMPNYRTIVDSFDGKRLNSPNDAIYDSQGNLYFTDPPYGLSRENGEFVNKQLDFQGVYLYKPSGKLILLTDSLTRPNGLALSPDESRLIVANSDPEKSFWSVFEVEPNGTLSNGSIFYDATDMVGKEKGLPDGLKINDDGIVFATGPGGVWIFNRNAKHLGTIKTGQATSNCAFGPEQKSLFITADMYLLRVPLK